MAAEELMTLIHAVAVSDDPDQDDIYELILDQMGNLIRYVDTVYAQMTQLPVIRKRYEGQELRDRRAVRDFIGAFVNEIFRERI